MIETKNCKFCGKELVNIAYLRRSKSRRKLLKEIEKCIIICSNCHRKLHAGRKLISIDDFLVMI